MVNLQMKMVCLNTKIDKRIFLTPIYRHIDILITQYYKVENVSRMFTTYRNPFREMCLSNDYPSASKIHKNI